MAKGGRKGSSGAAKNASTAAAKLQEDVWAQCDNPNCQKWRRLPPRTIIDENTPWSVAVMLTSSPLRPTYGRPPGLLTSNLRSRYCYMNPDEEKAACGAPEEVTTFAMAYNARKCLVKLLASRLSSSCSLSRPCQVLACCPEFPDQLPSHIYWQPGRCFSVFHPHAIAVLTPSAPLACLTIPTSVGLTHRATHWMLSWSLVMRHGQLQPAHTLLVKAKAAVMLTGKTCSLVPSRLSAEMVLRVPSDLPCNKFAPEHVNIAEKQYTMLRVERTLAKSF